MASRYGDKKYKEWVSYEDAKHIVQTARVPPTSKLKYKRWHESNGFSYIPARPDRVYLKEWIGWNDFLGNDNEFAANTRGSYRPYFDAMRYVHQRKFEKRADYKEAFNSEGWPSDIPGSPQVVYEKDWIDWPTWLGITIRSKIVAAANVKQCMALCTIRGMSANVIKVVVCKGGLDELKEKLEAAGNLTVYKMYGWEEGDAETVKRIFEDKALCSPQGEGEYIAVNMYALTFELDSVLAWWK